MEKAFYIRGARLQTIACCIFPALNRHPRGPRLMHVTCGPQSTGYPGEVAEATASPQGLWQSGRCFPNQRKVMWDTQLHPYLRKDTRLRSEVSSPRWGHWSSINSTPEEKRLLERGCEGAVIRTLHCFGDSFAVGGLLSMSHATHSHCPGPKPGGDKYVTSHPSSARLSSKRGQWQKKRSGGGGKKEKRKKKEQE